MATDLDVKVLKRRNRALYLGLLEKNRDISRLEARIQSLEHQRHSHDLTLGVVASHWGELSSHVSALSAHLSGSGPAVVTADAATAADDAADQRGATPTRTTAAASFLAFLHRMRARPTAAAMSDGAGAGAGVTGEDADEDDDDYDDDEDADTLAHPSSKDKDKDNKGSAAEDARRELDRSESAGILLARKVERELKRQRAALTAVRSPRHFTLASLTSTFISCPQ
jgi:hypothetical protein